MKSSLKIIRESKGLMQIQVAEKANISIRSYQRFESGKCTPNVITAQKIASILNVSVEELFPVIPEDAKSGKPEELATE